jgi:hypothetical protein
MREVWSGSCRFAMCCWVTIAEYPSFGLGSGEVL